MTSPAPFGMCELSKEQINEDIFFFTNKVKPVCEKDFCLVSPLQADVFISPFECINAVLLNSLFVIVDSDRYLWVAQQRDLSKPFQMGSINRSWWY